MYKSVKIRSYRFQNTRAKHLRNLHGDELAARGRRGDPPARGRGPVLRGRRRRARGPDGGADLVEVPAPEGFFFFLLVEVSWVPAKMHLFNACKSCGVNQLVSCERFRSEQCIFKRKAYQNCRPNVGGIVAGCVEAASASFPEKSCSVLQISTLFSSINFYNAY